MKKFLTISFTFIYLISSSGILFGQHLCMGRVNDSALFQKVDTKCGMSINMHMDMDDCFDDDWSLEIIEDEQQVSNSLQAPKGNFYVLFELELPSINIDEDKRLAKAFYMDNGPPERIIPPLYLFYSNIKIPAALQS